MVECEPDECSGYVHLQSDSKWIQNNVLRVKLKSIARAVMITTCTLAKSIEICAEPLQISIGLNTASYDEHPQKFRHL